MLLRGNGRASKYADYKREECFAEKKSVNNRTGSNVYQLSDIGLCTDLPQAAPAPS